MALSAEMEMNLNSIANVKCGAKPAHALEGIGEIGGIERTE